MENLTIQTTQPRRRPNTTLMAAAGAAIGAGARYVLPTKKELSSLLNKESVDTFVSSTAAVARANSRSILKYGSVGALVAAGISIISHALKPKKDEEQFENIQYKKYEAILDAPEYACQITWLAD